MIKYITVLITALVLYISLKKYEPLESKFLAVSKLLLLSILSWKVGSFLLHDIMNKFLPKINPTKKAVLITGCDTGFGNATAIELNNLGFHVFATCYNSKCDGAKELLLKCRFPKRMHVVQLDVTNDHQIDQCLSFVKKILEQNDSKLWGLVNNAGVGPASEIEWGNFDDHFTKTLSVNTLAAIKITRTFLPLIRASKGRISNVSSALGRYVIPMMAAYCTSKFALVGFTNSLRSDMRKFGVHVSGIEPNLFNTKIVLNSAEMARKFWNESSDEIKSVYSLKDEVNAGLLINDIGPVISAILGSLIDRKPKNVYAVNPGHKNIVYLMGYFLPTEIWNDLLDFSRLYFGFF